MSMKKPKIRFKGYTEDWEQRKLGDIADVTKLAGFEFTEHVVYSDEGNIIALRGLNIKNGQLILDDVKYIDGSNFSKLSRSKLFIDDIMFTYVGTVGEVAIIKENDRFYLAPNVSRIRVKSDDSPKFISHYMRTDNFKNKVIFPLIATSSQPALSMENIRKFTINIPISREEQDCLAKYFDNLDQLITLHQRKCNQAKKLKKYMLQKMFPQNGEKIPEIRFDGFTDDWEQRKLGEVAASFEYGLNAAAKEYDDENKYIRITDIDDNTHEFLTDSLTSPDIDLTGADNYKLTEGDILFARTGASVGKSYIYRNSDGLVYYAGFLIRARIKEEYDAEFVFQNTLTDRYNKYIAVTSQRSGQPGVNAQEYAEFEIKVPKKEEQTKIGAYFKQLDHLITLHQRKCDEMKKIKKFMLQNMFV